MKALILLSHGSRRRESNEEMKQLARAVADVTGQPFHRVVCAFQQFGQPGFEAVLADLAEAGASHVVVYPLFLASGNHVLEDVPALMSQARATYPAISFAVMPHLGQSPDMAAFLMDQAMRHV